MLGSDIVRIMCLIFGVGLMIPFIIKEIMFVTGFLLTTLAFS